MRALISFPLAAVLFFGFAVLEAHQQKERKPMKVEKITPVLLVNEIEPVLPFWIERLGFTKTIEVPDGKKLAFVTLEKGSVEVMYQTYASVERDAPAAMAAAARKGPTYLYLQVDDLDAVLAATENLPKVMPERTAFYGMREFAVADPAGHFVTFAEQAATPKR